MNAEAETSKNEPVASNQTAPTEKAPAKPINPAVVKKAIALGKEMCKVPDTTKAAAAMKMYELISGESREIIVQAFIEGAGLTEKGAQTYFYNCKRKSKKND